MVLGLGAGGEHAARKLAEAGLDVVAVERDLVGGECPFWGCTPSKLLIHSAHRGDPWSRAAERVREATHDWTDDHHAEPLEKAGVRIVRGTGRLVAPGRVEVDGATLSARRGVLLDTGTEPAVPDVDGLPGTPYWTNRDLMRLTAPPASLIVLGGGPIGCELAQTFARFGTRVTLVEVEDRLLGPEEPEAAEVVERALRADGVTVHTGADIARAAYDGAFTLDLGDDRVLAERLLVATGRSPHIDGDLEVDERMRAGERLWAVGDITGKGAFTHVAKYQARIAVRDLLGEDGPWADYRAVSRVTFTDPEVGAVGLTEEQAREAGIRVRVGTADVASSSRGWIAEAEGVVKVVVDADRGIVVGATTVAPSGGEVIGLLTAAVHAEIPVAALREMHYAYPTFHRAIARALRDV
ncbi:dihydrolipoyl dehydrogenase family protein [Nocardioides mangrovi]|uniref:NAD(P)/FAD-dependent oxidoreductase n=1 Tax=Nocardioides mangrovi TaxID=2874580 RepID=A0ABS7UKK4_9ACTN|nr:NAD(P)/FAD-dependent oxidoreductase [Nocardioides mangrovi]MBZ5741287.1 NAD(P)/FAD-dependent oxidoreductase [Nocardioides mangrovi]